MADLLDVTVGASLSVRNKSKQRQDHRKTANEHSKSNAIVLCTMSSCQADFNQSIGQAARTPALPYTRPNMALITPYLISAPQQQTTEYFERIVTHTDSTSHTTYHFQILCFHTKVRLYLRHDIH